ncbi:MAG: polysaccharide deacetylase family protein [Wenzhouxiangellaceae bacterium]
MKLLVSIHDVMPSTLGRVERIFDRLNQAGLVPVMLLVVPGRGWQREHLGRLRALVAAGAELAGHGWRHEVRHVRGVRHRLHSALISRRAGEHLALSTREILRLMLENHRWFARHDLPQPGLYVPPAWAMGPVPRRLLDRLPFDRFETLAGVYDTRHRRFHRLPMAGFEADTTFRAVTVHGFNRLNCAWARASGRPLRLGIHPDDFELKLADDLEATLRTGGEPLSYSSLGAVA